MALKVHKDGDNKNKNVCVSQFTRSSNVNNYMRKNFWVSPFPLVKVI